MTNKEAIEILKRATMFEPTLENRDYPKAFDLAIKALEDRPRGEWIDHGYSFYICNKCGMGNNNVGGCKTNFCPNCGADMRGGKND